MKEQTGKAQCPVCALNNSQVSDPEELPTNDQLLKAMYHKEAEEKAARIMRKYEILNPTFESMLLRKVPQEVVLREYAPHELELVEMTSDGELIYMEHILKSLHKSSPFAVSHNPGSTSVGATLRERQNMLLIDKRNLAVN